MKTLLLLILLLGVIALSSGTVYSCPKKCPEKCPPLDETSCEHGVVTDACKCCNVCGKGPGEVCNGISLKCGDGMYCDGDALKALYPCCYGLCVAKAVTSALKAVTSAAKPSILYNTSYTSPLPQHTRTHQGHRRPFAPSLSADSTPSGSPSTHPVVVLFCLFTEISTDGVRACKC